ncbi:MAG: TetR/AcrR family transcriptional regulator [Candidatus Zixiibacteriota bacterium]
MNESLGTRQALLTSARWLFARNGYDGTSIKMITARAHANLGAVTYHFGTKRALYDEVLRAAAGPLLERVRQVDAADGAPLARIAAVVHAILDHITAHRHLPALMLHELSLERPIPEPVRQVMEGAFRMLRKQVAAGQRDGSIVSGDPVLLTISIVAQPIYVAVARKPLRDAVGLDTADRKTRIRLADHMVTFLRRGLSPTRRGRG